MNLFSVLPPAITAVWLFIASVFDIRRRALPVWLVTAFLAFAFIWDIVLAVRGEAVLYERILSLLPGLLFIALGVISADKIGPGDGLAMIGAGQCIGAAGIFVTMCAAVLLCAVYALILITVGKASPKRRIAFIPFLLAGFAAAMAISGGAL